LPEAAERVVREWRFDPETADGVPRPSRVRRVIALQPQ